MSAPTIDMVITDLDGTLLNSDRAVSPENRRALEHLGDRGVIRVIATGRSLFSFNKVIERDFPLDYLLFSSGAGTLRWGDQTLLESQILEAATVERVAGFLQHRGLDFMIQRPIPDNHAFAYWGTGKDNPDFRRRIGLYAGHATPLDGSAFGPACQFVVIFGPGDDGWRPLTDALPGLSVVRATSPLDHQSTWMEIFPAAVSKSQAADRLCQALGVDSRRTLAVGNDYNDADLLHWAGRAVVVGNAPQELRDRHPAVGHHDDNGFAQAMTHYFQLDSEATP